MIPFSPSLSIDDVSFSKAWEQEKDHLDRVERLIRQSQNSRQELDLLTYICSVTAKYQNTLDRDMGIRRKEVPKALNAIINNLYNYLSEEIHTSNPSDIVTISRTIHKLLYPEWFWWVTMSPSGQRYFRKFESGKYRETQEFISLGWNSYYFIDPDEVSIAMERLQEFFISHEGHFLHKLLVFIFYFWNIHPFNDGNGTVAQLLFSLFLIKNGYPIIPLEFQYFFIDRNTSLFYQKMQFNHTQSLQDFIDYLERYSEGKK